MRGCAKESARNPLAASEERILLIAQTFYEFGPFRLDPAERVLLRDGNPVSLPPKAFDFLVVMVERAGRLVTKEDLLNEVWQGTFVEEANLTYTVSLLRKALGDDAEPHAFIETVSKRGYRFKGPVTRGSHEEPAVESRARRPAIWLVGLVVLMLVLAFPSWLVVHRRRPETSSELLRLALTPPPGVTVENAQISTDGQRIVFVGREGAGDVGLGRPLSKKLWIQRLDSTDASALPGTEGAMNPFWAPDSQNVAFWMAGQLRRINVTGGPTETLGPAIPGAGGSWNRSGVILFGKDFFGPLYQISASGGTPVAVTRLDKPGKDQQIWPQFLPDGRHFLYVIRSDDKVRSGLYIGSLDSTDVKRRLLDVDTPAIYREPGYLLYSRDGAIVAQRFDVTRWQLFGEATPVAYAREYATRFGPPQFLPASRSPHPLLSQPFTIGIFGAAILSASETGRLAYSLFEPFQYQFAWFDRSGKALGTVGDPGVFNSFDLSADGKRVIVARGKGDSVNLWVLDLERQTFSQVTFGDAIDFDPRWGPDGRIAWDSTTDIRRVMKGGLDRQEPVASKAVGFLDDWSPDGRFLIYRNGGRFALSLVGESTPVRLSSDTLGDQSTVSKDGRLVAFWSAESGRGEVYVQVFSTTGDKQQVSPSGGVQPVWRDDGGELYYLGLDGMLYAVAVALDGTRVKLGQPRVLFKAPIGTVRPDIEQYATNDGQRFLFLTPVARQQRPIDVIINWPAAIKSQSQ
jgi:DNA-binding winged helix-turn-helix (wHTH) protein